MQSSEGELSRNAISGNEISRKEVWKMFDNISSTYDMVNRILSFGIDKLWRRVLASKIPKKKSLHVLDCATGTGDQIFSLFQKNPSLGTAVGIDLSHEMLEIAKKKSQKKPYSPCITFQEASALSIPYSANTFDVATISFGIRNVVDVKGALQEMHRVLVPHGKALILEFSKPKNRILHFFHSLYLKNVLPFVGGIFSRNKEAYTYLQKTIDTFPCGEAFCQIMKEAGFFEVKAYPLTGGIATLYEGVKSECNTDL